ncbi:MAG: anti-sigma factor [Nocardioidaceae bacterium]
MNDIHSLAPLYVVGGLEDDEAYDFESHLASCGVCRQELVELRDLTAKLSSAVTTEPAAVLKTSIMARLASTPQDTAVDPLVGPVNGVASVSRITTAPSAVSMRRNQPTRLPRLVAAAAVLAALVVGGAAGWAINNHQSAHNAVAQDPQLTQLLAAGDVKMLQGQSANGAQGTVILSASQDRAVIVFRGLPKLPDGKVYELWTVTAQATPAGTFSAAGAPALVPMPTAALTANSVAVTVEPAGGSTHPTSTPVMQINLES